MDRIKTLNSDEKTLVMDLTERFEYIDMVQLVPYILNSLKKLVEEKGKKVSSILVAPLKSPIISLKESDYNQNFIPTEKTKSSDFVFGIVARKNININANIKICSSPKELINSYTKESCIALVDDFIGSGNTATNYVGKYKIYFDSKDINVKISQFNIVVAVAMKEGIDEINKYGMDCYTNEIMYKGITCDTTKKKYQRENNFNLMKSIESELMPNLPEDLSFGYHHSEALISILDKAPNNTFPFYWYTKGMDTKAIFRRNYGK